MQNSMLIHEFHFKSHAHIHAHTQSQLQRMNRYDLQAHDVCVYTHNHLSEFCGISKR